MTPGTHVAYVVDDPSLTEVVGKAVGNFTLPILVLGATFLAVSYLPDLPDFFEVLKIYAPYFTLGTGLLIAFAFKRGRAFFAFLSLLIAYACFRLFFGAHDPVDFMSRTVYASACLFVPLNLVLLAWLRERGALNTYGSRRLAALLIVVGLTAVVIVGDYHWITEAAYRPLLGNTVTRGSPIPSIAMLVTVVCLIAAVAIAVTRSGVIEAALAVSIAAFAAGCNVVASPDMFLWFTAAGLIMTAAVLQDSHRMAFRDELTGLPGRRALNESLMALDRHYTIAMLDVDHFKAFNDRWGHDVGDQVLKLVASRIQRVGGGGRAYRYGGEEFTVVFPGKRQPEVMARLDALRRSIDEYKLRLRSDERPRSGGDRTRAPAQPPETNTISVTVSVGVAERSDKTPAPDDVLRAADQALYRAKGAGRNRVSR